MMLSHLVLRWIPISKMFFKMSQFLKRMRHLFKFTLKTTDSGLMILLIKLYLARGGGKPATIHLQLRFYSYFNIILMSYRFECGLCSSVASAQLQFYPKKTQDRLIGLPVIVRLKWSEQGLMFLNQMRGLRQKEKEGGTFLPPPSPQILHTSFQSSVCYS